MAIWNEPKTPTKEPPAMPPANPLPQTSDVAPSRPSASYDTPPVRSSQADQKETLIAANLSIEGKIQGSGHVRVAGQFKGDVNVEGNLTIEQGAKVIGGVPEHYHGGPPHGTLWVNARFRRRERSGASSRSLCY